MRDPGQVLPATVDPGATRFDDGIPEIAAGQLDAGAARYTVTKHGLLHAHQLIPHDDVVHLVSVIDRVFSSFDAATRGAGGKNGWFEPFPGQGGKSIAGSRAWLRSKGGVLTGDSPRATFEVAEVFRRHHIDTLVERYLGQAPVLALDKWTLRRGTEQNGIEWHQDGSFLGKEVRSLNIWLALSACGTNSPSLDVVPRRLHEIVQTGTEGASYEWSVGADVVDRAAAPDGWRRLRFCPGDALLFDDKLLHRTGGSPDMTLTRYAIETWFFAPAGDTSYIDVPLVL
jgi:hypothetical protein